MLNIRALGLITLVAAVLAPPVLAPPVLAQQTPAVAPAPTPGVVATTNNPNLSVATVRLDSGERASKVIGATVYNDQNEKLGSVDDLIVTAGDKVTVAVISVGGFLGLGSKLVAVPYPQLKTEGDHITLAGATKDTLNAAPGFVY